jgi:hypothetical protein
MLLCSTLAAGALISCGPAEEPVGDRQRNFLGDGEIEVILTPPPDEGEGEVIVIRPVEEAEYEAPTVIAPPELPTTGTIPRDEVPIIRDVEHLVVLAERLADLWPPQAALACFADESQRQEIIDSHELDLLYLNSLLLRSKQLRAPSTYQAIKSIRDTINELDLDTLLEECPPQKPSETPSTSSPTEPISTPTSVAAVETPNDSTPQTPVPTSVAGKVATESAATTVPSNDQVDTSASTPTTFESSPTSTNVESEAADAGVDAGDTATPDSVLADKTANPQTTDSADPSSTDTGESGDVTNGTDAVATQNDDMVTEVPDDSDSSTLLIVIVAIGVILFLLLLLLLMRRRRTPE